MGNSLLLYTIKRNNCTTYSKKMARQIMAVLVVTVVTVTLFYQTQANSISARSADHQSKRGIFECIKQDQRCTKSVFRPCCGDMKCHLDAVLSMYGSSVGTCRPKDACKMKFTYCKKDSECCSGNCSFFSCQD